MADRMPAHLFVRMLYSPSLGDRTLRISLSASMMFANPWRFRRMTFDGWYTVFSPSQPSSPQSS
jgi:hypothetical protein